jgi:hypothetical protein
VKDLQAKTWNRLCSSLLIVLGVSAAASATALAEHERTTMNTVASGMLSASAMPGLSAANRPDGLPQSTVARSATTKPRTSLDATGVATDGRRMAVIETEEQFSDFRSMRTGSLFDDLEVDFSHSRLVVASVLLTHGSQSVEVSTGQDEHGHFLRYELTTTGFLIGNQYVQPVTVHAVFPKDGLPVRVFESRENPHYPGKRQERMRYPFDR